jgi:hypothetical protein
MTEPGRPLGSGRVSPDHPSGLVPRPCALHVPCKLNVYSTRSWIAQRPPRIYTDLLDCEGTPSSPSVVLVLPCLWNHDTAAVSLVTRNPQTVLEKMYIEEVKYF